MLDFCVNHQCIKRNDFNTIVANSVDFLEVEVSFSNEWKNLTKSIIFKPATGDAIIFILDTNNKITSDKHLNLSAGIWLVNLYGTDGTQEITSNTVQIQVIESGSKTGTVAGEPTPDVYTQIIGMIAELNARIDAL